jgi:hypothetical protein
MEKRGWSDRKALLKNFFGKHILLLECIHLTISSFYSGMLSLLPLSPFNSKYHREAYQLPLNACELRPKSAPHNSVSNFHVKHSNHCKQNASEHFPMIREVLNSFMFDEMC